MNIKIKLRKTSSQPVTVSIDFQLYLLENIDTVISIDRNITRDYYLEISRFDDSLYLSGETTHQTHVIVDSIVIDNFWEINEHNHWSKTIYSRSYINYLSDKPITWELSKDLYNNTIYFNGILQYKISTPIRGMFFK